MSFTSTVKADLLAHIEAIEPTPEINPLQAELDAALELNLELTEQRDSARSERDTLASKILAAQQALA